MPNMTCIIVATCAILLVHHLPHVHATFPHFPFMGATYRPNTHQKVAMQKVLHLTPFLTFSLKEKRNG
jgi:hypothetical protein